MEADPNNTQVQNAIKAAKELAIINAKAKAYQRIVPTSSLDSNGNGADGMIELVDVNVAQNNSDSPDAQGKRTTDWLSAYNAPHWMQLFKSTPNSKPGSSQYSTSNASLLGWQNNQQGTTDTSVELYGSSWMRDLMAARQYTPDFLKLTEDSWFNGATDANGVVSQRVHNTHDLGMSFDLGVQNTIGDRALTNSADRGNAEMLATIQDLPAVGWSIGKAYEYSQYLVSLPNPLNDQRAALRDFLSLYAVTHSDPTAGSGTWDTLPVANGEAVRAALFGTGQAAGGLISGVHIGGGKENPDGTVTLVNNQNPYPSINAILDKLGINVSPVKDHHHHFHVYLRPPELLEIDTVSNLLTDVLSGAPLDSTSDAPLQTEAQGLLDYSLTLIEGEELMFIMDVPYVPAQETPIVLVQADASGTTTQPDYILKACQETMSTGNPESAIRGVEPAGWLANVLEERGHNLIDSATVAAIKTTLLETTKHGKLNERTAPNGAVYYMYDPVPEYIGDDRAVFMAEFEGKRYKIIVNLKVSIVVDNNSPQCFEPKLIKVKKPSTGSSGYDMGSITVTFADLAAGALGQTNANGIILDSNAAGHNWFIDASPLDNSEFLPTSNPYEWVAKEGSAAYGKMDMLSVLLHEYGHALGIDHSADGHDYMATTLTAGVRRMPSAEELALMQQLVGEVKTTLSPSPCMFRFAGQCLVFVS